MNLTRIKEVVVLYGAGDSGKTGILCRLCRDYCNLFGSTNYIEDRCYKNKVDRVARVNLPDGRVLGIGTAGDNADTVLESFMSFHDQGLANASFKDCGCDIVVLAVRKLQSKKRHVVSTYQPQRSIAEIELEELTRMYGVNWKFLLPPGKKVLATTKYKKGSSYFSALCQNDATNLLKDIRILVGF